MGVSCPCGSLMYIWAQWRRKWDGEERERDREWRLLGLLYAGDLVLCAELEEDLRVMVGRFVEVCKRRGLKINADKSKVMVLNGV